MSILAFPATPARPRPAPRSLAHRCGAVWARAAEAWRIRQADRALSLMTDEMLHDIGIARSEIEDATRHGRPIRP